MRYNENPYDWGFGHGPSGHVRGPFRGFGLKFWVLSLVSDNSAIGAMISDKIENMSMGHWRPSPGQVYPLLEQMTEEGYLDIEIRDGKKYYSATTKGKELLRGSWFPWRIAGGLTNFNGVEDALKNIENLVEYVLDNKEKIRENEEVKKRIDQIVGRLKEI